MQRFNLTRQFLGMSGTLRKAIGSRKKRKRLSFIRLYYSTYTWRGLYACFA